MALPPYQQTFLATGNKTSLMNLYSGLPEYGQNPDASNTEYDPLNPSYDAQGHLSPQDSGLGQEESSQAPDNWSPVTIDPDKIGELKLHQLDSSAASLSGTGQVSFWRTACKVNVPRWFQKLSYFNLP